jgi:hypothetical protein
LTWIKFSGNFHWQLNRLPGVAGSVMPGLVGGSINAGCHGQRKRRPI